MVPNLLIPKLLGRLNLLKPEIPSRKPSYPHNPAITSLVLTERLIFFMQWFYVSLINKYSADVV